MLQLIPVDLFGDDDRTSGLTPPPDSRRQKQMRRSSSHSSNKTKNSTNKKCHSVSQSIDMLCQKIEISPMAQSIDGGGHDVYATAATFLADAVDASGAKASCRKNV